MTTIVLHADCISIDSQITCADRKYTGEKFVRGANGAMYFWCGCASNGREVIAALEAGQDALPDDETYIIRILQGGVAVLVDSGWYTPEATQTWGSGGDAALAAVLCGKDSRGACEVATQVDLYSGGRVRTFSVATGEELV